MFRDIDILIKGNEKDMECLITCVLCDVSILTDKVVYKIYRRPHHRKPMVLSTLRSLWMELVDLQPCNYQVSKSIVHEVKAVM